MLALEPGFLALARPVDDKAGRFQRGGHARRDTLVIFHQQESHQSSSVSRIRPVAASTCTSRRRPSGVMIFSSYLQASAPCGPCALEFHLDHLARDRGRDPRQDLGDGEHLAARQRMARALVVVLASVVMAMAFRVRGGAGEQGRKESGEALAMDDRVVHDGDYALMDADRSLTAAHPDGRSPFALLRPRGLGYHYR